MVIGAFRTSISGKLVLTRVIAPQTSSTSLSGGHQGRDVSSLPRSPHSRLLALKPQPHPHGLIVACGGEVRAIGGPCHAPHSSCMPGVGEQVRPVGGIPHLHRLVIACRGEMLAIGGPRYAFHSSSMPGVGKQSGTTAGIPHPHGLIEACRGGATLAIGGPRYALHTISIPGVGGSRPPKASIPHP